LREELKEELQEVKEDLKLFKEARRAIATGQSYRIGNRQLDRASLPDIEKIIHELRQEKSILERKLKGRGRKAYRAVPRDR